MCDGRAGCPSFSYAPFIAPPGRLRGPAPIVHRYPLVMPSGPATPALRCRVCGYDLAAIDFARAKYRCPECGEVNIPGDHRVAPIGFKPWPGAFAVLLLLFWPGLATGLAIGLHALVKHDWAAVFGVFTGLVGAVICLTWPWAAAEILLYNRVPERGRRRYMPWIPVTAIVGNIMLTVAIAQVMYLLG